MGLGEDKADKSNQEVATASTSSLYGDCSCCLLEAFQCGTWSCWTAPAKVENSSMDSPGGALPLSWDTRMKVALGAAEGLAFLHGRQKAVIYRDFKTSNILLDADYNSKLSDFGLAKDGPDGDKSHVSTRVMGTYGYAAPEYVMTGHLTARSDVYSFGVVLLEILTGRRSMDKSRPSGEHNLVEWARPYFSEKKKVFRLIDPRLGQYSEKGAYKAANLAFRCLSRDPRLRPMMPEVVQTLGLLQNMKDMTNNPHHQQRLDSRPSQSLRNFY